MSTELKSRNHGKVGLTRFWGGKDRRSCIQITTARDHSEEQSPADRFFNHVTMSRPEAVALAQDLLDFAGDTAVEEFDQPVLTLQGGK